MLRLFEILRAVVETRTHVHITIYLDGAIQIRDRVTVIPQNLVLRLVTLVVFGWRAQTTLTLIQVHVLLPLDVSVDAFELLTVVLAELLEAWNVH